MTSFDLLLDKYRSLADTERDKGTYFEKIVKDFFLNDGLQVSQYKDVWLWNEWPDRPAHFTNKDNGIDLVAERHDGGWTAIQAKFYGADRVIAKKDIDSFLSASSREPFSHAVVVDTTEGDWSSNAEEMLDGRVVPVTRVGLTDFRSSNIDWSSYQFEESFTIEYHAKKVLRPHQYEAVTKALAGLEEHDRGKLIMACGTGKTFTALKLAEKVAQEKGHAQILFMVPSLALMSQTLREWSHEREIDMHAYAVCSDTKVGKVKNDDIADVRIADLKIPATTDGKTLVEEIEREQLDEGMTVVFSTYQSIDAITAAQKAGLGEFDLIICDEAHRTTGAKTANNDESHFTKIHDNANVAGAKRIYMTATPRVFNDAIKDKARESDVILASMDDEAIYGPTFYYIGFGEAVTKSLLTDYKVLVLGVDEGQVSRIFQNQLADSSNELAIDDVAKLIGCWNGLAKRKSGQFVSDFGDDMQPMKRAVAFTKDIKSSKIIESEFAELVRVHLTNLDNEDPTDDLRVEVKHVDGGFNAIQRDERLDWLSAQPSERMVDDRTQTRNADGSYPQKVQPAARILTNARCLTEGVDVPSLDAVLFLNPRNSQVDVIQAVGRVMRNFHNSESGEHKNFGYIILPIAIPEGMSTSEALNDNQRYKVVWQVLQALRAHDERLDAAINQIGLNSKMPEQIVVETVNLAPKKKGGLGIGGGSGGPSDGEPGDESGSAEQGTLVFPNASEWKDSVYAKIVDKCGNRMYWADWSKDIADIAGKHITLIKTMLESADSVAHEKFEAFVTGLQENLNPTIDEEQAIEMLAQHLVTKPVFDAMFENSNFTEHNPISRAMQSILLELDANASFEKERAGLEKFYDSVRARVAKIDNAEAKQKIILELYDNFFRNAFPRVAERLGIVFTPTEVVDYILRSADEALHLEFGKRLTDEGVTILEPFVGTGTFITRLLQIGLIKPEDLKRKFEHEIYANEIVLLSYYIAAINIETVYGEVAKQAGLEEEYVPFRNIALTDTFQLNESDNQFQSVLIPENTEVIKRQKNAPIQVIVMNPPYSAGQNSANDNNQNLKYPELDATIADTYANLSTGTNKNSLYDSYIRAIRWASNRIQGDGVIAFVSNGSFIDGNTADGIRKTLTSEFSRLFVYNLRGNQRTSGETSRKEGGKIFGSGSRTQVAIAILVKRAEFEGEATLHYRDIGDYLSREDKLSILRDEATFSGTQWEDLTPNEHGDWINHRDDNYANYQPIGDKATKGKPNTPAIFELYSSGLKTNRDTWVTNYSHEQVLRSCSRLLSTYEDERVMFHQSAPLDVSDAAVMRTVDQDPTRISWDRSLRRLLAKNVPVLLDRTAIRTVNYRPFTKQKLYFEKALNNDQSQLPRLFPTPHHDNLAIGSTGRGSTKGFSTFIVNTLPDLELISKAQWMPLYDYKETQSDGGFNFDALEGDTQDGYTRKDNITDATLAAYRTQYADVSVTKEDIFYYVYGVLQHPEYAERYESDLRKELPRIPKIKDFWGFSKAGRALADLHLNYETVEPLGSVVEKVTGVVPTDSEGQYEFYAVDKMRWASRTDKTKLIYNKHITMENIPAEVFEYEVNGKPAIEWIIERYQITTDKKSLITNNPNDYSREVGDPRYIIDLVKRIVTVSLETQKIVDALPPLDIIE